MTTLTIQFTGISATLTVSRVWETADELGTPILCYLDRDGVFRSVAGFSSWAVA